MHYSIKNLLKVNKILIDKSIAILNSNWDEDARNKLGTEVRVQLIKTRLVKNILEQEKEQGADSLKLHRFFNNDFFRPPILFFMRKRVEKRYNKLFSQYVKLNGINNMISNRIKFYNDFFNNPFLEK